MKTFQKEFKNLKKDLVNFLMVKDLIGKDLYIRDEVSNLTGGMVDDVVSGMSAHCLIIEQDGEKITCELDSDTVECNLSDISIELLLLLI